MLLGIDGIADFNGLHSHQHDDEVQLYGFDVVMSAGNGLRPLSLHLRKNHLAKMRLQPGRTSASRRQQLFRSRHHAGSRADV